MKELLYILIYLNLISFSGIIKAENLLQIYRQAKINNLELQKSALDRDEAFEKINETRSLLLPKLSLNTNFNFSKSYRNTDKSNSNITDISLQLTQTLFDMSKWHTLTFQEKAAYIKDISYQLERQTLILNTARAYFNALSAIGELSCSNEQKNKTYNQLNQTMQRFKVGLVAIADVQNAKAQYSKVLANEVAVKNHLENALESLRQITGNFYIELASLNIESFKIEKLQPISVLLKEAENHNLKLLQARLNKDLAREQIRRIKDDYLPTLNLIASINFFETKYKDLKIKNIKNSISNTTQNKVNLNFLFPIYQGGITKSRVKQAKYEFINASKQLEIVHRNVVQTVRSSLNNVASSISNINAYKQALIYAQSALASMEANYSVGMCNIVDLIYATTTLYEAKQQLLNAYYNYINNFLTVKFELGVLNEQDLLTLNKILGKPNSTSSENILHKNLHDINY